MEEEVDVLAGVGVVGAERGFAAEEEEGGGVEGVEERV